MSLLWQWSFYFYFSMSSFFFFLESIMLTNTGKFQVGTGIFSNKKKLNISNIIKNVRHRIIKMSRLTTKGFIYVFINLKLINEVNWQIINSCTLHYNIISSYTRFYFTCNTVLLIIIYILLSIYFIFIEFYLLIWCHSETLL